MICAFFENLIVTLKRNFNESNLGQKLQSAILSSNCISDQKKLKYKIIQIQLHKIQPTTRI